MIFNDSGITWNFEVNNEGKKILPFQHVMHPLMKLDEITGLYFPGFKSVFNKSSKRNLI